MPLIVEIEDAAMIKLQVTSKIEPVFITLTGLSVYLFVQIIVSLVFAASNGDPFRLQYFWSVDLDIPSEFITRNFSPTHITFLITSLILIAGALAAYRRRSSSVKKGILHVLVIFMVGSEIVDWVWYILIGHYSLRSCLPLHLCSASIFVEFAAVLWTRNVILKEFAYALSMPAALAALITPGWYYPLFSFQYLQSALTHTLLILVPVLIVWGGGFRPDFRRLPGCFLLLLFLAGIAAAANNLFGGNYMFLGYVPKDTTLQVFERWFGHPGYIFFEVGLILVIWLILYLPWIADERKRNHGRSSSHEDK